MDMREHDSFPRISPGTQEDSSYALGIVTAIVVIAAFAMVAAWFALLILEEGRTAPSTRADASSCNICGVVERMREVEPGSAQALEGSRAEGAIVLVAALSGAAGPGARPARIYETSVVHDDGSTRVLRETNAPQWNIGDRVRVIKGRVESDVSPAGRTPTPVPPAARGW